MIPERPGGGFGMHLKTMSKPIGAHVLAMALALLAGSLQAAEGGAVETGFVNFPFTVNGADRTAALYVPAGYDKSMEWPLIVFLHGGGGNGDNAGNAVTERLNRQTLVRAIRANPERFPALVVFPRCPEGKIWSPIPADPVQSAWRLDRHGREPIPDAEEHITAVIDALLADFSVAPDRVILTGHSMGGEGSIRYAALHPERIAAVAPSAGSAVVVLEDARVLAGMGVWLFQGETDRISTAPLAKRMVAAIQAAGGNPHYTEYKGVGHGMSGRVYQDAEVIAWMLEQRRSGD